MPKDCVRDGIKGKAKARVRADAKAATICENMMSLTRWHRREGQIQGRGQGRGDKREEGEPAKEAWARRSSWKGKHRGAYIW